MRLILKFVISNEFQASRDGFNSFVIFFLFSSM